MTHEDQLARFVDLAERERELKADLEAVASERIALQAAILQHWADNGTTQQRVKGLTLYPQRAVYVSAPKEAVAAAGLDELIGVNTQSLSAWYREHERSGEPLPASLVDTIKITERTTLRTRRGS